MNAQELVALNVRRIRVKRGLTQEALAIDAEVGREYVSSLEGGRKNPTVKVLERVATALGVEIGDLFLVPRAGDRVPRGLRPGRKRSQ